MQLAGSSFVLRAWQPGDEKALVRHANHREVWRNLTNRFPHPYTAVAARDWIAHVQSQGEPVQNFAIVVAGEPVGGCGFERREDLHSRVAEIGYWLGPDHWGRGIATEALALTSAHALAHFDFVRLEAGVLEWNPASCRVLEKNGYRLDARLEKNMFKDGQVIDGFLYSKLREP